MARREPCAHGAGASATPVRVRCRVAERDLLLCVWLDASVFQTATRHMLLCRFEVRIDGTRLEPLTCVKG